jgi:hypothetical protein
VNATLEAVQDKVITDAVAECAANHVERVDERVALVERVARLCEDAAAARREALRRAAAA